MHQTGVARLEVSLVAGEEAGRGKLLVEKLWKGFKIHKIDFPPLAESACDSSAPVQPS
jgi:hypothetical protein